MKRLMIAVLTIIASLAGAQTIAAPEIDLPKTLNGLKVAREDVDAKTTGDDYLEEIGLYSLRRAKQLEATLQIGRFRASAPTDSLEFRRSIATQVGDTVPVEHRVGGDTIFVSRGKRLAVAAWFRSDHMFILSIRETYGAPKALLREVLEVRP